MDSPIWKTSVPARAGMFACGMIMIALAVAFSDIESQRAWTPAVEKWGPVGAGVSAAIFLLLALFWPWLAGPETEAATTAAIDCPKVARGEWWIPATIVLLAMLPNVARLHHPLWGDEERTVRNYVLGQYKPTGPETVKWRATSWGDTVFDYQSPNNHGFYSALARVAHGGKDDSRAPQDLPFQEWKVRLPALVASGLAVILVWWMARSMGWRLGAASAALIFAAHPWFVRYSTEARGYGLLFLLVPLAVWLAIRALQSGQWRWWLALAVVQAMLFMTWMLQLHWLLVLNGGMLAHILLSLPKQDRARMARRQFATGIISAALVLPIQLPAAMQLVAWMEDGKAVMPREFLDRWVADVATTLLTGEPWYSPDPGNPLCPAASESPGASLASALVPTLLLVSGILALATRRERWVVLMPLAPLFLLFLQSAAKHSVLLPWYASPVWPMAALLMGAGVEGIARRCGKLSPWAALALVAAAAGPWQWPASLLRRHPMEDNRAAVLATRGVLNPEAPGFGRDAITVSPQLARPAYDPLARKAETIDELRGILREASATGLPVFVHAGDPRLLAGRNPGMWQWLANRSLFEAPLDFPGMDGPQRRMIWKWTGKNPD